MEITVFQRIQKNLEEKRQNITEWLRSTPDHQIDLRLGPAGKQDVHEHLEVIDDALEKVEDQRLGVCEVCHDTVDENLLEMDYTACICLDHYSDQERRQLETELEFLQVVQRALLPQPPTVPGLELAVFSRPAQVVSGDYFDFFQFQDGALGLAIADIMGHGITASMLMTGLQTALRTLIPENTSPAEVLQRINRVFLHNINFTTFLTALLFHYDPSNRKLTYCNAGHNPPLLYRQQGASIVALSPTGPAIGLVEDYQISIETIPLSEGDVLLLYTDGVTEATNPQMEPFGPESLAQLVQQDARLPAQDLIRTIHQSLFDFTGTMNLEDDITLMVCKVNSRE